MEQHRDFLKEARIRNRTSELTLLRCAAMSLKDEKGREFSDPLKTAQGWLASYSNGGGYGGLPKAVKQYLENLCGVAQEFSEEDEKK